MEFSTHDNENDDDRHHNCAASYGNAGNWWGRCGYQNMNGVYGQEDDSGYKFMSWFDFNNYQYHSLKTMKFMIRPAV